LTQATEVGPAGSGAPSTGLKRNSLTMPEVLAQSVANMAPSAAMALLPLLVFSSAGNATWLSWLIAVALMAGVGLCAAQFARRMNSAGSFYVWVTRALGPGSGHAAGWALQLGYIATGMATLYGFAIFGSDFLNRVTGGAIPVDNEWLFIGLAALDFGLAVTVAIFDMKLSARTSLTLEAISITIIGVICVAIWVHRGSPLDVSQISLKGSSVGGAVVGIVLAIFSFVGFESAGSLGAEARNPQRAIGRAILASAIAVGFFYVVVSYSQIYGFEGVKGGILKSSAPLPDLAGVVGLGFFAPIVSLGITASMFACTLACVNAAARIAYAMAHDGMGTPHLTRTHGEHLTPHVAIWVVSIPMIVITVVPMLFGQSAVNLTGWTGTVATFGFMLAYGLVGIAAPVFLSKIGAPSAVVAVVGIVSAAAMAFVFWASWLPQTIPGGLFAPLTGVYVWLPYVFLAWTAVGLIWHFVVRARSPHVIRQIGMRFDAHEEPEAAA
jgi:amino acid transporter